MFDAVLWLHQKVIVIVEFSWPPYGHFPLFPQSLGLALVHVHSRWVAEPHSSAPDTAKGMLSTTDATLNIRPKTEVPDISLLSFFFDRWAFDNWGKKHAGIILDIPVAYLFKYTP